MLTSLLARVGRGFFTEVRRVVSYATLTLLTLRAAVLRPHEGAAVVWTQCARQVVFTGADGLWLVGFIASLGAAVLMALSLSYFGGAEENRMVIDLLTRALVREVAPLTTAILVALRSGSAITVELGYMSARGEVEGIEAVGMDPFRLLLLPRFVGVATAMVGLTWIFALAAFVTAGGIAIAAQVVPANMGVLLSYASAVQVSDLMWALGKAALFGVTISAVVCYHGLSVGGDVTEMPRRVARALVEVLTHCTLLAAAFALLAL